MAYRYYNNCVCWPQDDVFCEGGLSSMVESARDITRATFLKKVDREELGAIAKALGYASHPSQGMTMASDRCISYHRSKLHGRTVYYFRYSGIEYVFRGI